MAYLTNTELKTYLTIPASDTADDTLLTTIIGQAQKWFETKTKRVFEASTNTVRYFTASLESRGGNISDVDLLELILDWDLCAINSITNGDGVVVTSAEYTTKPKNFTPWYAIRLLPSSSVGWTFDTNPDDAIAISGKWAWSEAAPADVKFGVTRLAGYLYKQRDNFQTIDQIVFTPTGATLLPPNFPRDVADLVMSYRRV